MNKFFYVLSFLFILPLFANAESVKFVVPLNSDQNTILQKLIDSKFILDKNAFNNFVIAPGAYKLSTTTSSTQNEMILKTTPYMKWVVIPPGLRKEEIANVLAKNLNWSKNQKDKFLRYTNLKYDNIEGVYFPDTYLIPVDEDPAIVQKRFISKFNEIFKTPLQGFNSQGFPWIKALTLASIVQREAASKDDMSLIAGILLNRIDKKIPLSVDATLQYVRGDKNANIKNSTTTAYWAPITVSDKKLVSAYNTYKKTGLPPHPISSPSLDAINAVLNPANTTCLYYLHDRNRGIHCADTYEEHQNNINIYLKN